MDTPMENSWLSHLPLNPEPWDIVMTANDDEISHIPALQSNAFDEIYPHMHDLPDLAAFHSSILQDGLVSQDSPIQSHEAGMSSHSQLTLGLAGFDFDDGIWNEGFGYDPRCGYNYTSQQGFLPDLSMTGPSGSLTSQYIGEELAEEFQLDSNDKTSHWGATATSSSTINSSTMRSGLSSNPQVFLMGSAKNKPLKTAASQRSKAERSRSFQRRKTTSQGNVTKEAENRTTGMVEAQERISLVEESFSRSILSAPPRQRKASYHINQLKKLVLDELNYGSSQSSTSEFCDVLTSTACSSHDSLSSSEFVDSGYPTDLTSVSSSRSALNGVGDLIATKPREPVILDKTNADSSEKTVYCCTFRGCDSQFYSCTDWKRHEESKRHWPQVRFMCLKCPVSPPPSDASGNPICQYCDAGLGDNPTAHYLECTSARQGAKNYGRSDHLIAHIREVHGVKNATVKELVDAGRYKINQANWPRQCGFCGVLFENWDERMMHIAKHYHNGHHISDWRLPYSVPKDFRSRPPHLPPRDDDSDGDDSHGGSGHPHGKAVCEPKIAAPPPGQHNKQGRYGASDTSSKGKRRRYQESAEKLYFDTIRDMKEQSMLERYLSDININESDEGEMKVTTLSDHIPNQIFAAPPDIPDFFSYLRRIAVGACTHNVTHDISPRIDKLIYLSTLPSSSHSGIDQLVGIIHNLIGDEVQHTNRKSRASDVKVRGTKLQALRHSQNNSKILIVSDHLNNQLNSQARRQTSAVYSQTLHPLRDSITSVSLIRNDNFTRSRTSLFQSESHPRHLQDCNAAPGYISAEAIIQIRFLNPAINIKFAQCGWTFQSMPNEQTSTTCSSWVLKFNSRNDIPTVIFMVKVDALASTASRPPLLANRMKAEGGLDLLASRGGLDAVDATASTVTIRGNYLTLVIRPKKCHGGQLYVM